MAIDIYTMTAIISRASKAYCDNGQNSEIDRLVTLGIVEDLDVRCSSMFQLVNRANDDVYEFRNFYTNKKNMEFGGYFAQSGLHKIRY